LTDVPAKKKKYIYIYIYIGDISDYHLDLDLKWSISDLEEETCVGCERENEKIMKKFLPDAECV